MENVNKRLLEAVKHCHGIFDQYVSHHLAKPDYDKAAANERHRAICAEAIAAAEQQAEPNWLTELRQEVSYKKGTSGYDSGVSHERVSKLLEMLDRYAAQQQVVAVPEGYALVPVDPTSKMLMAADRVIWADADILGNYCNLWNAMLAASQKGEQ